MVTFELIEENDEIVKYKYFPEDKRQLKSGIIILNKKTRQMKLVSVAENDKGHMYAAHAMSKIAKAYERGEILSSGMVAWY